MRKYRVVGAHAVDGVAPGGVFEADYSPEHERVLVEGGHIRPVGKPQPEAAEAQQIEED